MTTTTLRMTTAGIVLMLASSAQAVLITPTGVTATSEQNANRLAIQTINGDGLTGDGSSGSIHVSGFSNGVNWNTDNTNNVEEIRFDLGGVFTVATIRIWNFNEDDSLRFGSNSVEVLTSNDDSTYTSQGTITVAQGTGLNTYVGADYDVSVLFGSDFSAQYIRFDILSNYNSTTFGGSTFDFVGLSEVRFESFESAPEPNSIILASMAIVGLALGRRRRNR